MSDGFGLDNLPYGAVARGGGRPELAVRLGDDAVLLGVLEEAGLLAAAGLPARTLSGPVLNPLLALGRDAWAALRATLQELLADGAPASAVVPLAEVEPRLPLAVGDYVDFYSSLEHATNLGRMFRPDAEPLLPNWRHLPVGYHGRASSVVVSRHAGAAPARAAAAGRAGRRAVVRPDAAAGHRARAGLRHRSRERARHVDPDRRCGGPRVRLRARERLERA